MQFSLLSAFTIILATAVDLATADMHKSAVCITGRKGGTGNINRVYEIMLDATKCACTYYKNRNTGNKPWDSCADCTFDGLMCNSQGTKIGGDEFNHYCEKKCGAQGSEAN